MKRLLFKPYKVSEFLDSVIGNFPKSKVFKDNCIVLGYTFIALLSDHLLDMYWTRIEDVAGKPLVRESDIEKVKGNIFKQLMPINYDCVKYSDFKAATSIPEWNLLKYLLGRTIETIQGF